MIRTLNKKHFYFMMFLVFAVSVNADDMYRGISEWRSTPVNSAVAFIDDDPGVYGEYDDDGFTRNMCGKQTLLQRERAVILSSSKMSSVTNSRVSSFHNYYLDGQQISDKIVFAPVKLEGYYLMVLAPYGMRVTRNNKDSLVVTAPGVLNTTNESGHEIYVRICASTNESHLLNSFTSGTSWVKGRGGRDKYIAAAGVQRFGEHNASSYRNAWVDYLQRISFTYSSFLFVRDTDGNIHPALIVRYGGTAQYMYAMYGIWQNEQRANKSGYKKGDRIFFSEAQSTPLAGDRFELLEGSERGLRKFRHGAQGVWNEAEITANPDIIKPQLAWRTRPYWGTMTLRNRNDSLQFIRDNYAFLSSLVSSQYQASLILSDFASGRDNTGFYYFRPLNPDDTESLNPSVSREWPDLDWYYSLFKRRYEEEMRVETAPPPFADMFLDYESFMTSSMREKYDPTQYSPKFGYAFDGFNIDVHEEESMDGVRTDMPSGYSIYSKDGDLLSGDKHFENPAQARYYLKGGRWSGLRYRSDRKEDITSKIYNDVYQREIGALYRAFGQFVADPHKRGDGNKNYLESVHNRVAVEITNTTYYDSAWYPANRNNHHHPFENQIEFFVHNGYYRGETDFLYVVMKPKGWVESNTIDILVLCYEWMINSQYYIRFKWPLVFRDRFGMVHKVGYVHYLTDMIRYSGDSRLNLYDAHYSAVYSDERISSIPIIPKDRGADASTYPFSNCGSKSYYNHYVTIEPDYSDDAERMWFQNQYVVGSKDWNTDQIDVADRADGWPDDYQKAAMWEIAKLILVAEGVNLGMKVAYDLAHSENPIIMAIFAAIYETGKRIENWKAVQAMLKVAAVSWKVYKEIQETLELIDKMQTAYKQIGVAWDGLQTACSNIYDYYDNFDWSKVRMTNISSVLPTGHLRRIDYAIAGLQYALIDFNSACDKMAIKTDMYIVSPAVKSTKFLMRSLAYSTTTETSSNLAQSEAAINDADRELKRGRGNATRPQYFSLVTGSVLTGLSGTHIKVTSDGVLALKSALNFIEAESRDWQSFYDYTTTAFSEENLREFNKAMREQEKPSLYPFFTAFGGAPTGIFNRDPDPRRHTRALNVDFWASKDAWNFTNIDDRIMRKHARRREAELSAAMRAGR